MKRDLTHRCTTMARCPHQPLHVHIFSAVVVTAHVSLPEMSAAHVTPANLNMLLIISLVISAFETKVIKLCRYADSFSPDSEITAAAATSIKWK